LAKGGRKKWKTTPLEEGDWGRDDLRTDKGADARKNKEAQRKTEGVGEREGEGVLEVRWERQKYAVSMPRKKPGDGGDRG